MDINLTFYHNTSVFALLYWGSLFCFHTNCILQSPNRITYNCTPLFKQCKIKSHINVFFCVYHISSTIYIKHMYGNIFPSLHTLCSQHQCNSPEMEITIYLLNQWLDNKSLLPLCLPGVISLHLKTFDEVLLTSKWFGHTLVINVMNYIF